jgi:ActR/RegA family two-component response regulator
MTASMNPVNPNSGNGNQTPTNGGPRKTRRVLVVEDDKTILNECQHGLSEFDVLPAGPQDPVRQAREIWDANPDLRLAIVDLSLPEPDAPKAVPSEAVGLRLIQELKRQRPDSRILVFTGHGEARNYRNALKEGATALYDKGKYEDLYAHVRELADELSVSPALPPAQERTASEGWSELTPEMERQRADVDWAFSPEAGLLDKHPGKVVVVYEKKNLVVGDTHQEALCAFEGYCKENSDAPRREQVSFVSFPDFIPKDSPFVFERPDHQE